MKKLLILFLICSSFILSQQYDPPAGYTPYYGLRLYNQGDKPGADSINQNYLDIDQALHDLKIYLSKYFRWEADSILYPSDSFWNAVDSIASSGGGATTFLELTDTPPSYTANADKLVVANSIPDGLEFSTTTITQVDDAVAKRHAAGTETLGGDLSGTVSNATVDKIKNIPIDAPTAVDHNKVATYDSTGGNIKWAGASVSGSGSEGIGYIDSYKFDSGTDTWTPLSGLSGETIVQVTIDATYMHSGIIKAAIDGIVVELVNKSGLVTRVLNPTSSLTIYVSEDIKNYNLDNVFGDNYWNGGFKINRTGTKIWAGGRYDLTIYQASLPSAGEFGSAVYSGINFDCSPYTGLNTELIDFTFNLTESKFWLLADDGTANTGTLYQFSLSTPGDISTASYDGKALWINSSLESIARTVCINADEDRIWVGGANSNRILQYNLSTPGDLATAVYTSSLSVGAVANILGLYVNLNSSMIYFNNADYSGPIFKTVCYEMTTPKDITTGVYREQIDLPLESDDWHGLTFTEGETKMWLSSTRGAVREYILNIPGKLSSRYQENTIFSGKALALIAYK